MVFPFFFSAETPFLHIFTQFAQAMLRAVIGNALIWGNPLPVDAKKSFAAETSRRAAQPQPRTT